MTNPLPQDIAARLFSDPGLRDLWEHDYRDASQAMGETWIGERERDQINRILAGADRIHFVDRSKVIIA